MTVTIHLALARVCHSLLLFCLLIVPGSTQDHANSLEPEFVVPLPNLTLNQGSDVSFTCVVKNLGDYKVVWIRSEDKAIIAFHNHMVTHNHRFGVTHNGHNTFTLHIKNVQGNDSGTYMCQVNTDPRRSQSGTLQVIFPAGIIDTETSKDVVVDENQPATLTCKAKGYPPPEVRWKREDGALLPISKEFLRDPAVNIKMWEGERLPLRPLLREDTGPYLCIANNSVPPLVSKRVMVYVHFKTSVTATNQLVTAPLGVNITLVCEVQAAPIPVFSWTNKEKQILLNSVGRIWQETEVVKNYIFRMTLSIYNLQKDDFGEYNCSAGNSLGGDFKVIKVERKKEESRRRKFYRNRERHGGARGGGLEGEDGGGGDSSAEKEESGSGFNSNNRNNNNSNSNSSNHGRAGRIDDNPNLSQDASRPSKNINLVMIVSITLTFTISYLFSVGE